MPHRGRLLFPKFKYCLVLHLHGKQNYSCFMSSSAQRHEVLWYVQWRGPCYASVPEERGLSIIFYEKDTMSTMTTDLCYTVIMIMMSLFPYHATETGKTGAQQAARTRDETKAERKVQGANLTDFLQQLCHWHCNFEVFRFGDICLSMALCNRPLLLLLYWGRGQVVTLCEFKGMWVNSEVTGLKQII